MQSRTLFPLVAIALVGVLVSCDDSSTGIDENFQDDATWTATLNGANERPTPNNSPATGRAWFVDNGPTITYYIEYSGLVAPGSNAHIHRGTAEQSGSPIIQLPWVAQTSGVVVGTIDMTRADVAELEAGTQTATDLRTLFNTGGVYVNIHSNSGTTPQTGYPGGEIRGQIVQR